MSSVREPWWNQRSTIVLATATMAAIWMTCLIGAAFMAAHW